MEDFPANNQAARVKRTRPTAAPAPEPEKHEKVVTGKVITRKPTLGKRFLNTFVGGNVKSVWNYVLLDVLVPAAKDVIADAVSQGVEKMVFGDSRPSRSRSLGRAGGYTNYNRYSQAGLNRREDPRERPAARRASHDLEEIILETRVEAHAVIDGLFEIISKYEVAKVSDLNELVGQTGTYTDEKWGWTDLRGAGAIRVRDGYLLDLPKPEPLD